MQLESCAFNRLRIRQGKEDVKQKRRKRKKFQNGVRQSGERRNKEKNLLTMTMV